MSAPTASSCIVVLKQQQEQAIQHHHEPCAKAAIVPCKTVSPNCTIVENGQVVVKPLPVDAVNELQ